MRLQTAARAFIAGASITILTVGCGNSGQHRTSEEAAFIARANAICRTGLAGAPSVPTPTQPVADAMRSGRDTPAARSYLLRWVSTTLAVGEPAQRRFRQLRPPAAFRSDIRRIDTLGDEQRINLLRMRKDAIVGNVGAAVTIYQAVVAEANATARINRKLGLQACS
jgi:hypothetical protein